MDESTSGDEQARAIVSDQRIGSYRVIHPLGAGGMSSVFRAVHEETGQRGRAQGFDPLARAELDAIAAVLARGPQRRNACSTQTS